MAWMDSATSLELGAAFGGFLDRFFDQRGGVLGGLGAALRQVADFVGDHREAHAGLAGARRFDRGVQREDVGLEGDLVDDFDDLGDLVARRGDLPHGRHHLAERAIGFDDAADSWRS